MIPVTVRAGLARTHKVWGVVAVGCAAAAIVTAAAPAVAASWEWPAGRPPSVAPVADRQHPTPSPTPIGGR